MHFVLRRLVPVLAVVVWTLWWTLPARAVPSFPRQLTVHYQVTLEKAGNKAVLVEMRLQGLDRPTVDVAIPAWTPGSYEILNYAQYLSELAAKGATGQALETRFVDKQTWRIQCAGQTQISVRYRVICDQLTVDSNWLGPQFGQLQGAATFLYLVGETGIPRTVEFTLPSGWNVAMPLTQVGGKTFTARDYEALIDAPMVLGKYRRTDFTVQKIPFSFFTVRENADIEGLQEAITKIALVYAEMMGSLPFDRYFLIYIPFESNSLSVIEGLEHANSTVINFSPETLVDYPLASVDFLSVTAHEIFHAWNVKRLRPKELVGASLAQEVYTPSLWFAEGVTDYYAMLGLVRAKLIRLPDYAAYLERNLNALEEAPGRQFMSLEDASLATWLTGTSNFQNIQLDYYGKGAVVAALLDIELRAKTEGRYSLDEVVRAMYNRFPETGPGYSSDDILQEINRLTGVDVTEFFRRNIKGSEELPSRELFEKIGLQVTVKRDEFAYRGFGLEFDGRTTRVIQCDQDSPAEDAGLENGDIVLSVNQETIVSQTMLNRVVAKMTSLPGPVDLKIKRRKKILSLTVAATQSVSVTVSVKILSTLSPSQQALQRSVFQLSMAVPLGKKAA
ncbi:MAG: PDZ domain-containing protein [Acidobacteria bacterium]|nr:PDZ domain-containing protein [Acidobacteriota bacterium]